MGPLNTLSFVMQYPTPTHRGGAYLLMDPAVRSCGAALLVQESVEIYRLDAAAAPVLVST